MARASTGARNIVVGEVKYRWRATGVDEGISLVVWPAELAGAPLSCCFDYDQTEVSRTDGTSLIRQIVVTARIVRRVIEYAIRDCGYDPRVHAPELELKRPSQIIDLSDAHRSK